MWVWCNEILFGDQISKSATVLDQQWLIIIHMALNKCHEGKPNNNAQAIKECNT